MSNENELEKRINTICQELSFVDKEGNPDIEAFYEAWENNKKKLKEDIKKVSENYLSDITAIGKYKDVFDIGKKAENNNNTHEKWEKIGKVAKVDNFGNIPLSNQSSSNKKSAADLTDLKGAGKKLKEDFEAAKAKKSYNTLSNSKTKEAKEKEQGTFNMSSEGLDKAKADLQNDVRELKVVRDVHDDLADIVEKHGEENIDKAANKVADIKDKVKKGPFKANNQEMEAKINKALDAPAKAMQNKNRKGKENAEEISEKIQNTKNDPEIKTAIREGLSPNGVVAVFIVIDRKNKENTKYRMQLERQTAERKYSRDMGRQNVSQRTRDGGRSQDR